MENYIIISYNEKKNARECEEEMRRNKKKCCCRVNLFNFLLLFISLLFPPAQLSTAAPIRKTRAVAATVKMQRKEKESLARTSRRFSTFLRNNVNSPLKRFSSFSSILTSSPSISSAVTAWE